MSFVYHGSSVGGLEIIKKQKGTHQKECVYAVENEVIALLFAANEKSNGDYDVEISIENDIPVITERWPGILEKIYRTKASLYKLDSKNFNHYEYLWEPEVISFCDETVIEEIEVPDVLSRLREFQNEKRLIIYDYPARPDYIPLDNSDLIETARKFEEMGITGAEEHLYELYPQLRNVKK